MPACNKGFLRQNVARKQATECSGQRRKSCKLIFNKINVNRSARGIKRKNMKTLDFRTKKMSMRSIVVVLALLLVMTTTMIAQNKSEQTKLLVSSGFTITKIDGKKKTVNAEKTVTILAGKHTITYNHTYVRELMGAPSQITMYDEIIEFEFETGKSYKLDVSAEIVEPGFRSPGPPKITEQK